MRAPQVGLPQAVIKVAVTNIKYHRIRDIAILKTDIPHDTNKPTVLKIPASRRRGHSLTACKIQYGRQGASKWPTGS